MLSDLEVLLNAERSLMDEDKPFDFGDWTTCTCGHIYHGATGEYGSLVSVQTYENDVYGPVMRRVVKVLGLEVEADDYAGAISDYTMQIARVQEWQYSRVTREDSLKVIREAIEKIREMDLIKIRDAHNYEVVNASQSH